MRAPVKSVGILGGGRWARVLLDVTRQLLPADGHITWATNHGYDAAAGYLAAGNYENVSLVKKSQLDASKLEAAIVASAPEEHFSDTQTCLNAGLPTLCEKPLGMRLRETLVLREQAKSISCPLGVNLEFHFACYLQTFSQAIAGVIPQHIKIEWLDPIQEIRSGETKHANFKNDIVHDMLPHCWSLLRVLFPNCLPQHLCELSYTPGQDVKLQFTHTGGAESLMVLSREADRRVRRLSLNAGEAILDFSQEPGWIEAQGSITHNTWGSQRPLSRSLASFFSVVEGSGQYQDWPLAIDNCLVVFELAAQASTSLRAEQLKQFERWQHASRSAADLFSPEDLALVVDTLAPQLSASHQASELITRPQREAFVRRVLSNEPIVPKPEN